MSNNKDGFVNPIALRKSVELIAPLTEEEIRQEREREKREFELKEYKPISYNGESNFIFVDTLYLNNKNYKPVQYTNNTSVLQQQQQQQQESTTTTTTTTTTTSPIPGQYNQFKVPAHEYTKSFIMPLDVMLSSPRFNPNDPSAGNLLQSPRARLSVQGMIDIDPTLQQMQNYTNIPENIPMPTYGSHMPGYANGPVVIKYEETRIHKRERSLIDTALDRPVKLSIAAIQQVMSDDNDNLGFGLKMRAAPQPIKWVPFFIPVLTIAQIAYLIAVIWVAGGFEVIWVQPLVGPKKFYIDQYGSKFVFFMKPPYNQLWRFLSAWMLHEGILHIVLNMLWQVFIGIKLERKWSGFRIAPIYIIAGVGGVLISSVFLPNDVGVGNSCCLGALITCQYADFIYNWRYKHSPFRKLAELIFETIVFFLSCWFIPFIDNYTNVGGMFLGFFLGLTLCPKLYPSTLKHRRTLWEVIRGKQKTETKEIPKANEYNTRGIEQGTKRRCNWRMFTLITIVRLFGFFVVIAYFIILLSMFYGILNWNCTFCWILNPPWEFFFGSGL